MEDIETISCADADEWDRWLSEHGQTASAVWLTIAKKGSGAVGITAAEAGDVAICHGWIDGHRRGLDETHFLQRYSPRRPGSAWSRVNVERVEVLEAAGRMRPAGRAQVAAAKADGRWAAAYAPQSTAAVPDDLAAALAGNDRARAAFEALGRSERYATFLPLLKARTPAARSTALRRAVATLEASGSDKPRTGDHPDVDAASGSSRSGRRPSPAAGPLVVSAVNPRYFTIGDDSGKAVYLTGSHIWNNLHDGMGPGPACAQTPEALDYGGYLDFLAEHGHNVIRLWRWEQVRSQAAGGDFHLCMTPQPWARTGPGNAKDGKPKFDLDRFDQSFFDRLRGRVARAGERGIYVAVMLFDGWALHLSPAPDNVEGHPFHAANNVNGIGIGSIVDYQVLPLDPRVQALQEAYVRKVVDTLHDLPNLLWEVANESSGGGTVDAAFAEALGQPDSPEWGEDSGGARGAEPPEWGDSTQWQYWVIELVQRHERERGYDRHPIGMTMQFPVPEQTRVNEPLFASRAEWISPGYDDEVFADGGHPMAPGSPQSRWLEDPPAADGRKVVISDTDHYAPGRGDALWAWKSFLRGHHPILMDFGLIGGIDPPDPSAGGPMSYSAFEPARYAMGDTLRFAERVNLLAMQPRGELSSTGYVLASPGEEYLVLQPGEDPITVQLEPGTYVAEWFGLDRRETSAAGTMTVESAGATRFDPPTGPVVLYLRRAG